MLPLFKPIINFQNKLKSQFLTCNNRFRRGLVAIFPRLLAQIEVHDDLVRTILTPAEYNIYCDMDIRDQNHSLWVARHLLQDFPNAPETLVAAALLHDVGKSTRPFCAIERITVHLLAYVYKPQNLPPYPKRTGWQGAWQDKWHHEYYGSVIIHQAGGRSEVSQLVADLARAEPANPHVRLLKKIDERS